MVGEAIADRLTGTMAFGAIGAALFDRERTGRGAHIDIAMFDCMLTIMQCALADLSCDRYDAWADRQQLSGRRTVRRVPHGRR